MRILKLLFALTAVMALLPVASASAGRLVVTGHDSELHCSGGAQCHFVEVATNYVRGGAPDPAKPVLVLDRLDLDFVVSLDNVYGPGALPRVVMDPRGPEFAAEPLTTDRYSAILVASDITCGGCDLNEFDSTPDSDAINARTSDIEAFFNAGGGLFVNAGASHGNGTPGDGPDNFYNFLPLPVGGVQVQPPFCLTSEGVDLGFEDPLDTGGCPDLTRRTAPGPNDDINCCATHNSFTEPEAGTALKVAERDTGDDGVVSGDDAPETLFAEGIISGGRIITAPPPAPPAGPAPPPQRRAAGDRSRPRVTAAGLPSGCVRRAFTARFRIRDSSRLRRVTVSVDGRRVKRTTSKRFAVRINAARLRAGQHTIRVVAIDRAGNRRTLNRVFARCAQARRPTFTG